MNKSAVLIFMLFSFLFISCSGLRYNIKMNNAVSEEKHKNYKIAIKYCTEAIGINPNDYNGYILRGIILFNMGKYKEAIFDFTRVLKLKPKAGLVFSYRSGAYRALYDYGKAISDIKKAIEICVNCMSYYDEIAGIYLFFHKFDTGIKYFSSLISNNKTSVVFYYWRGKLFFAAKRYKEAIKDFSKIITEDKGFLFRLDRALAYSYLEQYGKALVDYNVLIKYANDLSGAYFGLAQVYFKLKRYKKAHDICNYVIKKELSTYSYAYYLKQLIN